ncbi:MAG: ribbon-helix-helix domain-containing protein [Thermoplasmatota archaeon]
MTGDDNAFRDEAPRGEAGVEYRATIRFPRKDYEFMQKLIEAGEYTNITEIVRDAVKRFRLEWSDAEAMQRCMPMLTMRGRMMPMMRQMMQQMSDGGGGRKRERE